MEFARKLAAAENFNFDELLYDEVRTQAQNICTPQLYRPTDSPTVESASEIDFESGRSEYASLENNLFHSFNMYIAGEQANGIQGDTDLLSYLGSYLTSLAPESEQTCGHIFQTNEPTYFCRDCAVDSTCVLCRSCFFSSSHMNHNYKIHTSSGVGYCDCGDPEAWRKDAWCRSHRAFKNSTNDNSTPDSLLIDDMDSPEKLRKRINNLPSDIVIRMGRLLKPLLNSAILCLIDLVQGTSCYTNQPLSSKYRQRVDLPNSESEGDSYSSQSMDCQTLDDLWATDDCALANPIDEERALVNWPPDSSHIPLVSPLEDAVSLNQDSWPRTAPKGRTVTDVEARALAQLRRARSLHPRLFPPRSMRTASDRTSASRSFAVVLYNNEYHNYEQVIKTLRRVLDCTTQQGTHHAVQVNCDGRTVLQMNQTVTQASNMSSVIMRTSTSLSTRPLNCSAEHVDVYTMEVFFTLFLRWLRHFCDKVPSLRPVVSHALLGFFPCKQSGANGTEELLPVLVHGEMVKDHSLLSYILNRHSLLWRSVRQEMLRLIMNVLLKDPFYRHVFAIKFARSYSTVIQNHIYDDHLEDDSLCGLSCQIFTVISLSRHLLEQNSILTRIISRLERAFEANSITLPEFYSESSSQSTVLDMQEDCASIDGSENATGSWLNVFLQILRRGNPFEWGNSNADSQSISYKNGTSSSRFAHSMANCVLPEPRVLSWQAGNTLGQSWFHPFERLFIVLQDIGYLLASLTNVRPLVGDADNHDGWWTEASRSAYLEYFRSFLRLLTYVQDMNGMQRETRAHVEQELEWTSGFFIMSHLISVLGLTVQVASTDYELYKLVLREARQVFESRIGIMDRRFRINALTATHPSFNEPMDEDTSKAISNELTFQSLGVTTEVYVYYVSDYRISLLQPIPRILANLYGHGLEMGFSLSDLGLQDHSFVNLLIERPLQIITFCAQCNAKMWVRNGFAVQQSLANLFGPTMRVELIDRDMQLLQLASCILPPDEFLIRLVHKLNLRNYLKSDSNLEPGTGRVHAMEMLLRVILTVLTSRTRPSVGVFTKEYYSLTGNSLILDSILTYTDLEALYPMLVEDVIHTLCLRPMAYSELLAALPYQPTSSLLLIPMVTDDEEIVSKLKPLSSTKPIQRASVSRSANKSALEEVLPRLLQQLATKSHVGGRTVFTLRPEVMAYRFNRFHWSYRHSEQTAAESNVSKCLKKWFQDRDSARETMVPSSDFPIPPPFPRPLCKFSPTLHPGPLGLVRCTTFVRLLKTLMDIALAHGTITAWWSDSLMDLLLHLLTIALYEDELEANKTGRFPFLEAVARVPIENESDQELAMLALSHHWLNNPTTTLSSIASFDLSAENCLTTRLLKILHSTRHEDHSDLIQWVLNLWRKVAQLQPGKQKQISPDSQHDVKQTNQSIANSILKLDRAEKVRARRAKIMSRMSHMQRCFMNTYSSSIPQSSDQEIDKNEVMDVDLDEMDVQDSEIFDQTNSTQFLIALGPNRSISSLSVETSSTTDATSDSTAKKITCNLCLEEVSECASTRMVLAAHVCRSSVLSSHEAGWLEGPNTFAIRHRLSIGLDNLPLQTDTKTDGHSALLSKELTKTTELSRFLGSVATTAVAHAAGTFKGTGLTYLPELLSGIRSFESSNCQRSKFTEPENNKDHGSFCSDVSALIEILNFTNDSTTKILDPWHPRPLVSSRDPVAEEGSFLNFCSHPMHAQCKAKYARQLKARVDHVNRHRTSSMLVYDFRCPLCKSISTLDIPVLGPIYSDVPIQWLRNRLSGQSDPVEIAHQTPSGLYALSSWLRKLERWLFMSRYLNEEASMSKVTNCDFTLPKFVQLLVQSSEMSSHENLTESNVPLTQDQGQTLLNFVNSILNRAKSSLLIQDTSLSSRASESIRRGGSSSASFLNPLRRQFWNARRFIKQSSDSDASTTNLPSNNPNCSLIPVGNLLPAPPDPPQICTNLFAMVQRLAILCQPKPIESLVQRPLGRRVVPQETILNPEPVVTPLPNEDNEDEDPIVALTIVEEPEIQINLFPMLVPMSVTSAELQLEPNSTSSSATSPPQAAKRNISQPLALHAPPSLSEAIDQFHLDLMSLYERLRTLETFLPSSADSKLPTCSSSSEHGSGVSDDISPKAAQNVYHLTKCSLERVSQRAQLAVRAAACEWRALRHSVAYTLMTTERALRQNGPNEHFFNGSLAERHLLGLHHFLRASFTAHARHATVSRGCSSVCDCQDASSNTVPNLLESTNNHRNCWPQLRDHPLQWWWWSYFAPINHLNSLGFNETSDSCRLRHSPNIVDIANSVIRVAVTEDARFLWRLLLTPVDSHHSGASFFYEFCSSTNTNPDTELTKRADQQSFGRLTQTEQSISLLWEVDITSLFINLLFLRPGLEEQGLVECQCCRPIVDFYPVSSNTANADPDSLSKRLLSCDEGRPRQAIGDMHEANLVRLCYIALLVQSLLAWEPSIDFIEQIKREHLISQDYKSKPSKWNTPKLLQIWQMLRRLSGLPAVISNATMDVNTVSSLGLFLRAHSLPFLRIAAFLIHSITQVDVPADLRQSHQDNVSSEATFLDQMNEHALLLSYLGLPSGPDDLLVLLSTNESDILDGCPPSEAGSSKTPPDELNVNLLSESVWLVRLITSWCLASRPAVSRQLFRTLSSIYPTAVLPGDGWTSSPGNLDLLPLPNVRLPSLIKLPNEYTTLLSLMVDFDCHVEGHIHSDLSICLVCGHLACLFCYSCRQFESRSSNSSTSNSNATQEFSVYGMQAHSRRCHSGYSFLLRIHACRILLLSDQARRLTELPAPYRDSFGETDPDLRRGNPLFLVPSEYQRLNQMWINHQLAANTSSELVTPSNFHYGIL